MRTTWMRSKKEIKDSVPKEQISVVLKSIQPNCWCCDTNDTSITNRHRKTNFFFIEYIRFWVLTIPSDFPHRFERAASCHSSQRMWKTTEWKEGEKHGELHLHVITFLFGYVIIYTHRYYCADIIITLSFKVWHRPSLADLWYFKHHVDVSIYVTCLF